MNQIIKWVLVVVLVIVGGYAAYRIYDYLIADATQRIRQGVSEGASEGIGKGVGGALNPLNLFKGKQ